MDPDQARRFVGPDLGPNCLQSYQQTTAAAGKEFMVLQTRTINSWFKRLGHEKKSFVLQKHIYSRSLIFVFVMIRDSLYICIERSCYVPVND